MQNENIERVAAELFEWCRQRGFSGHDPFDALNSRVFQATPLKHSIIARLYWTQLMKRTPADLRRLALVPPGLNPKGIALFALAELAQYRRTGQNETAQEIRRLIETLLELRLESRSGTAWGYNFDWQSRVFYAPRGTPAIVPTAFAVRALTEASQVLNEPEYLTYARSACDFIVKDLSAGNFIAYIPNSTICVYNASLLGAETLVRVGALSAEKELLEAAILAARYVVKQQRLEGAWEYGEGKGQNWIDNFHTAYLLSSLHTITQACERAADEFEVPLRRGFDFWRTHFFLADGCPKYYHDRLYPIDSHAAAAAIITFLDLRRINEDALPQAARVADWSIRNMRDEAGFFFYQKRRFITIRTPFMRWTQSWMLYALARLLEEQKRSSMSSYADSK